MNKLIIKSIILGLSCSVFLLFCTRRPKYLKEEYYESGNIKNRIWFNQKNVPVDSAFSFFENGNYSSIKVRDKNGILNGTSFFYYSNGNLYQKVNYINGLAQGFLTEYYMNGKVKHLIFYSNDREVGDRYFYDSIDNHMDTYNFFDFQGRNRNLIKWDSLGKILKDQSPLIHIDSVKSYRDSLLETKDFKFLVQVLISNQPNRRSKVVIEYKSREEVLIKKDSIEGQSYYCRKEIFKDSVFKIVFRGELYDSLTKETYYQSSACLLDYENNNPQPRFVAHEPR